MPGTVEYPLGKDATQYINTAAEGANMHGTPTWTENNGIVDLRLSLEYDKIENTKRGGATKTYQMALQEAVVSWNQAWDPTDTLGIVKIRTAHLNKTRLDLLLLDGPVATSGQIGVRGPFKISKFEKGESRDGLQTYDIEACPCIDGNYVVESVTTPLS